jgi:hypothetical protein
MRQRRRATESCIAVDARVRIVRGRPFMAIMRSMVMVMVLALAGAGVVVGVALLLYLAVEQCHKGASFCDDEPAPGQ